MRFGVFVVLLVGACRSGFGPSGSDCSADTDCSEGLQCIVEVCRDPAADDDSDGLDNLTEEELGTHPGNFDTDGDLLGDGDEGSLDSDADGIIDALESAVVDRDLDCLPDQFDAMNTTPLTDTAVAKEVMCSNLGICASHVASIRLTCRHVEIEGQIVVETHCDYTGVPGYDGEDEGSCDGLDNDCDGAVDEGLAYLGPDGSAVGRGEICNGIGACESQTGIAECAPDGSVTCSVNADGSGPKGSPEGTCNGVDNDCNGVIDDGLAWQDPGSAELVAVGGACQADGVCGIGVVECGAAGAPVCSSGPGGSSDESGDEKCDGLDNDCDGEVDEGQMYAASGGGQLALGEACGRGPCAGGTVVCGDGEAVCSSSDQADSGEWCNGIDDDCDGAIDEPVSLAVHCPDANVGVCSGAAPVAAECVPGEEAPVCAYGAANGWQLEETLCDGLDNDCDGETDEGLGWMSPQGVWAPLGTTCSGTGACAGSADGVVVCHGGVGRCSTNLELIDMPELCNGIDDDCDSETDEVDPTVPGGGVCKAKGVCEPWTDVLPTCDAGQWSCGYDADPSYELIETQCDDLDNDCDGLTDEATPKAFSGEPVLLQIGQPTDRLWDPVRGSGGSLWQAGGLDPELRPLDDVWHYHPAQDSWHQKPALPAPAGGAATAWIATHGALLVHGGMVTPPDPGGAAGFGGTMSPVETFWLLDPGQGAWVEVSQQLSAALPNATQSLARAFHAMCAMSDGTLVLVGGRVADSAATASPVALRGTLTKAADDTWSVIWEPFEAQPTPRVGHRLLCEPSTGAVIAIGGTSPGLSVVPFVEGWTPDGSGWTALAGTPTPTNQRLFVATGYDEGSGLLAIHGGFAAPTSGGTLVSDALAGAWRLDLGLALVGTSDIWTPWEVMALVPAQGGGALLTDSTGWLRLGGTTQAGLTWRLSWRVGSGSVVPQANSWHGPSPRVGATVVVAPKTGVTYLVGGARGVAMNAPVLPLQDVLSAAPALQSWTVEVPSAPPTGDGIATTKPSMAFASGLWDPVGKRALLIGGVSAITGDAATKLWAYVPDASGGEGDFVKVDAQGEKPAAAFRPIFGLGPNGATAWLYGAHEVTPATDSWTQEPFGAHVWSLSLANSTWTRTDPISGPIGTRAAGGVHADGIDALVMNAEDLALWEYDTVGESWTKLSVDIPLEDGATLDAFVYDPLARVALALLADPGSPWQASLWTADFQTGDWIERDGIPPTGAAVAMTSHPSLGALGLGGHSASGVSASLWRVDQVCASKVAP